MMSSDPRSLAELAGGRERVAASLERQSAEAGEELAGDEALAVADRELHAMRSERGASPLSG